MRKPENRCPELEPGSSNRSSLERVELKAITTRTGDPWRCKKADLEVAVAVLERLPDGAPCPIVVNAAQQVLVGHIFVEAARKLKLPYIVVVRHEGLTELEEKHYSVAINQLLGKGGWEPTALEQWVREFEAGIQDFSHVLIGFENGELDKLLGVPGKIAGVSEDEVPALASTAVSKLGMLWKLGQHFVLVGDATDSHHFARMMAGAVGKLALTDPPFGCKVDGFVSKKGLHRDFVQAAGELSPAELHEFFLSFARNLAAMLAKGSLVYIFIDWRSLHILLQACEEVFGSLLQFCCWVKDRAGMGGL